MDQLRKVLAWLKANHFWVLSVLVAVIALLCWKMAAAKLSKEFTANKTTITSEFNETEDFRSKPFHPNDDVNQKQAEQIDLQAKNVEAIWKSLYERQTKGVLTWPTDLSQEFRDYRCRSTNSATKFPASARQLPRLHRPPFRIAAEDDQRPSHRGRRPDDGRRRGTRARQFRGRGERGVGVSNGRRAARMAGALAGQDDDYVCEWHDQGLVRQELDFPTTPSAWKIWVTQENLWVYQTLLEHHRQHEQSGRRRPHVERGSEGDLFAGSWPDRRRWRAWPAAAWR